MLTPLAFWEVTTIWPKLNCARCRKFVRKRGFGTKIFGPNDNLFQSTLEHMENAFGSAGVERERRQASSESSGNEALAQFNLYQIGFQATSPNLAGNEPTAPFKIAQSSFSTISMIYILLKSLPVVYKIMCLAAARLDLPP